jgi:hypothetical protein
MFEAGPMSISIHCPTCGSQALASDDYVGKKVVCPRCKATITVTAPVDPSIHLLEVIPIAAPVLPAPPVPTAPPAGPTGVEQWDVELVPQNPQFKTCDYCGEAILIAARKCKHCGEMLDPSLRAAEEAQRSADWASTPAGPGSTVVVESPREFPHLIHAVITVFFCGAWLPVWILHYALSGREGGKAIAWLVGIPLCVSILACGGCLTIGIVGSIMSPRSGPEKAGAEGKDSRKLANADAVGDERQNGPLPKPKPDTEPASGHETDKPTDPDDVERRRKQDEQEEADKKRAEEQEAERKKNDPEEIRKREEAEAAKKKEAEEEAVRKAKKKAEDDEAEAARLLISAKKTLKEANALKDKKTAEERTQGERLLGGVLKRLEGIVDNYPKTKSAQEAKKMIADFDP